MNVTVSRSPWRPLLLIALTAASCQKVNEPAPAPAAPPKTITSKTGAVMVLVPAGWFDMGRSGGAAEEAPVHRIHLDAFLMDATEVTQDQYIAIKTVNPSHFKGGDRPVEQISWAEAARFCNLRSEDEGLTPCYDPKTTQCNFEASGYRLPTEAEWEYACRAGASADDEMWSEARLADVAWYADSAGKTTHPVSQKRPNAWGFYDMIGNVAEWCNDPFDAAYYASSPEESPRGPSAGKLYVLRGGAWNLKAAACRPTARLGEYPGFQDACFARDAIGLRCVRRPGPGE